MQVAPYKTDKVTRDSGSLKEVLDKFLPTLHEGDIVAITSKVVAICEGRVVAKDTVDKEQLMQQESDLYLPASFSSFGYHFTITHNTLISAAGIDESNGAGYYVLWPEDPQKTANNVRSYLAQRYHLKEIGVIITDSVSQLLRRGAMGTALAHSGFRALNNYTGKPDLFGRPFLMEQANVVTGLAAAAVLTMGEGSEQTPLAVISEVPFVIFQERDPSADELSEAYISLNYDLYAPFLSTAPWQKGENGGRKSRN